MTSKTIFRGKIINLEIEKVVLPNNVETDLEIIRHPGGAAIVALDPNFNLCLLRQYRHVCKSWIWELPAGKIDHNEDPIFTAQRELEEEAGLYADNWQSLGDMLSSPGIFTEIVHIFLATDLTVGKTQHESEELIEIHWLPLHQAFDWAINNKINDAKSVIGILRAFNFLHHN